MHAMCLHGMRSSCGMLQVHVIVFWCIWCFLYHLFDDFCWFLLIFVTLFIYLDYYKKNMKTFNLIGWSSMNRHIKYHIGTILGYMWYMWFNMGIAYNHDTLIAHSTQTSYYNWLFNCYLYVKIAGLIFTLLNCFITLKLKFSLNTTFVDWVIFCFSKRSCNMSVFCPFITPFMESVYNILIAYLYNFSI